MKKNSREKKRAEKWFRVLSKTLNLKFYKTLNLKA
jgi:hypothetical protein